MLGLHTQASMKEYIEMTIIPEEKDIKMHSDMMIEQLLSNNETLITEMRKDIDIIGSFGDQGTEDFLTALIQKHEKDAWILRSLQAKG
jgi:starvation-inducible DNA-binding protein